MLGTAVGVLGAAVVLVATLTPVMDLQGLAAGTPLLCLVCGDYGGADVAANLLLFLPLALGLRLSGHSWRRTVLVCGLLSLTVELLQLRVVSGRDSRSSDLLTNTTSAALGATLGGVLPGMVTPRPREAATFLAGGIVRCSSSSPPLGGCSRRMPGRPLSSSWAHIAPGFDVFSGGVESVHLNGAPMPSDGAPADSAALRRGLAAGSFELEADVVSGVPVDWRSWIYTLRVGHDGRSR